MLRRALVGRVNLSSTNWLGNSTEIKLEITSIETEVVVGCSFFVQLLGFGSSPSTNSRAGIPIRELNTAANCTTRPQLLDGLQGHTLHRATGLHCQGQEAKGHRPAGQWHARDTVHQGPITEVSWRGFCSGLYTRAHVAWNIPPRQSPGCPLPRCALFASVLLARRMSRRHSETLGS